MRTLSLPPAPRWAVAALAPLALIGLGVLSANPDYAYIGDPARLAVLAGAILALAALRVGWPRVVAGMLVGLPLLVLPPAMYETEILQLRGEKTDLVVVAAPPGADLPCVLRRADGGALPHDVYEYAGCVPPSEPQPFPYLVDPAGWVRPQFNEGNDLFGPEVLPIALTVLVGLWAFVVLGTGRHPSVNRRQHPDATDRLPDA
ncbi:hypothetical protein [Kitasatospora sp. NPDC059673]|uniref:hypothetical protein n=1 Tax=Kitasatospora sp. NPDC059673 TaxID=3346901 RepID=UPI0036B3679D